MKDLPTACAGRGARLGTGFPLRARSVLLRSLLGRCRPRTAVARGGPKSTSCGGIAKSVLQVRRGKRRVAADNRFWEAMDARPAAWSGSNSPSSCTRRSEFPVRRSRRPSWPHDSQCAASSASGLRASASTHSSSARTRCAETLICRRTGNLRAVQLCTASFIAKSAGLSAVEHRTNGGPRLSHRDSNPLLECRATNLPTKRNRERKSRPS
jgi:hypothetical protein